MRSSGSLIVWPRFCAIQMPNIDQQCLCRDRVFRIIKRTSFSLGIVSSHLLHSSKDELMISLVIICPWLFCCLSPNTSRCVDRRLHHPNVHSLDICLDSITTVTLKFCVSTANVDLRSLFLKIRIEIASHLASCFWNREPEYFISSRNFSTADPWRVACQ
jgi:hypothetical protein